MKGLENETGGWGVRQTEIRTRSSPSTFPLHITAMEFRDVRGSPLEFVANRPILWGQMWGH